MDHTMEHHRNWEKHIKSPTLLPGFSTHLFALAWITQELAYVGEQFRMILPFGARFPTPHPLLYSNRSDTVGSNPLTRPSPSPNLSSSPSSNSSLGIPTRNQNRHCLHANDGQKDQLSNRRAAIKLILEHCNKHVPFDVLMDENWKGYVTQFNSLCE